MSFLVVSFVSFLGILRPFMFVISIFHSYLSFSRSGLSYSFRIRSCLSLTRSVFILCRSLVFHHSFVLHSYLPWLVRVSSVSFRIRSCLFLARSVFLPDRSLVYPVHSCLLRDLTLYLPFVSFSFSHSVFLRYRSLVSPYSFRPSFVSRPFLPSAPRFKTTRQTAVNREATGVLPSLPSRLPRL